uniref:Axonemal dynein light chain domain containing 1 n=1 Tax=Tetraodon nigroviridis TaxID=99883 RepID=H3CXT6_TETNG
RRPDAVWHHSLGRKKYKFFLEQPACLSGAGRDISFLCDAVGPQKKTTPLPLPPLADRSSKNHRSVFQKRRVSGSLLPEEYRVVKNKGLKSLELYEDAFTVQLQDDERKLHVFPSLRPSGRLEVLQLMERMDNMVLEAGLDRRGEQLTELSQMESLLEAVQAEQNIYNTVFHELIRQVTVSCAERGQLLAKLRQRYQSLLERIPRCVKALHTEAVAQRVLNHRLAQEMSRIRTSFQQLSAALSTIREHHHLASQEADQAHQHLAGAVEQARSSSDVVQGYHELYQLHRSRLETQLLRTTEERDCWIQLTFALANKIISTKKLHTIKRLHVSEQSWFEAAEHCCLYLSSKDSQDLEVIVELSDRWKEQLRAFMSQLKSTEHLQRERLSVVHQGTIKWLSFCNTQNKCRDPKCDITTLESITADLQQWVNMLVLHCECYQGEKLLGCQEQLAELHRVQKTSLSLGLQLLKRHPSPDGELPGGRRALSELDAVLSELLHQLDARVSGDNGGTADTQQTPATRQVAAKKLGAAIRRPEAVSTSDWLSLEEALLNWQSLLEALLQNFCTRPEEMMDTRCWCNSAETDKVLQKMQDCMSSLSNLTDGENQRLSEEVSSLHMAQTRWMLNLLLLVVPDHSEVPDQELGERCSKDVSPCTLEEDAKSLSEKLESLSSSIRSSCELVLEEGALQHPDGAEKERNELGKLQTEASEWVETCRILLSGLK